MSGCSFMGHVLERLGKLYTTKPVFALFSLVFMFSWLRSILRYGAKMDRLGEVGLRIARKKRDESTRVESDKHS